MKICIIGFPRSRSSILLETISIYYGIKILGQDINELYERHGEKYITTLRTLLKKNEKETSGVIRLHPLQMASNRPFEILNFEWFNFKQYDEIYFTFRESAIDNIASVFVASKLQYTYKSKDHLVKNAKFYFDNKDQWCIRDHVRSLLIVDSLKTYLKNNNISYKDLYYNDIPTYLLENFPGAETFHIETTYDYKSMVVNYSDIEQYYKNYEQR
jgi:hypothetical protein